MSFCTFYIFYLFVADKGVSLAPTYSSIVVRKSDLRSSSRTIRLVKLFFIFLARYILTKQKVVVRRLDYLNDLLILFERGENIKALDH